MCCRRNTSARIPSVLARRRSAPGRSSSTNGSRASRCGSFAMTTTGVRSQLDSLLFRFVPDAQTQISLLTSGDADFVEGFPPELLHNVQGKPGVHVVRVNDLRKA